MQVREIEGRLLIDGDFQVDNSSSSCKLHGIWIIAKDYFNIHSGSNTTSCCCCYNVVEWLTVFVLEIYSLIPETFSSRHELEGSRLSNILDPSPRLNWRSKYGLVLVKDMHNLSHFYRIIYQKLKILKFNFHSFHNTAK